MTSPRPISSSEHSVQARRPQPFPLSPLPAGGSAGRQVPPPPISTSFHPCPTKTSSFLLSREGSLSPDPDSSLSVAFPPPSHAGTSRTIYGLSKGTLAEPPQDPSDQKFSESLAQPLRLDGGGQGGTFPFRTGCLPPGRYLPMGNKTAEAGRPAGQGQGTQARDAGPFCPCLRRHPPLTPLPQLLGLSWVPSSHQRTLDQPPTRDHKHLACLSSG